MSQQNQQLQSDDPMVAIAEAEATSVDSQRFRIDGNGKPRLVGGRCRNCGCETWGARTMCPRCWAAEKMEEVDLPNVGALYSMVTVYRAQAGFKGPYTFGLVDLPGCVRVFGRIHWPEGSRWQPGAEMELIAERIDVDSGKPPFWVPAFRPTGRRDHA